MLSGNWTRGESENSPGSYYLNANSLGSLTLELGKASQRGHKHDLPSTAIHC